MTPLRPGLNDPASSLAGKLSAAREVNARFNLWVVDVDADGKPTQMLEMPTTEPARSRFIAEQEQP